MLHIKPNEMHHTILIVLSIFWINSFSQNIESDCHHYFDSIAKRKVYTFVDSMPEFYGKGGFTINLVSNIKIDSIPKRIDTKGRVEFIVETDGKVSNVKIADTINKQIDTEVFDFVIKSKWKPGFCYNRPVPVKMIMPYRFDF